MKEKKSLVFLTHNYPYGTGESFVREELISLSALYQKIYIVSLHQTGSARALPVNAEVITGNATSSQISFATKISAAFFVLGQCISSGMKMQYLKKFRYFVSSVAQIKNRANNIAALVKPNKNNIDFYSFWGDDWATALAMLKKRGIIDAFTMRLHGFDLYRERWPAKLIPFRSYQLSATPQIHFVSHAGMEYFQKENPRYQNIEVRYLRSADYGMAAIPTEKIIVSCGNVISIKRVDLLAQALRLMPYTVKWIHFGDGPEMEQLKKVCSQLPAHILYTLAGYVTHQQLVDYYLQQGASVFVHLSSSEGGVPLVLQEAISMGIPVVATNTGGVPEIVNDSCGKLLPHHPAENAIATAIQEVIQEFDSAEKRKAIRQYWKTSVFGNSHS